MKTSSLSVRVSDDDAAFLSALEIAGATTPSEKLRALLHAERRRSEGVADPIEAADMFRDLLQVARRRWRRAELNAGIRSDFIARLHERLPELFARIYAGPVAGEAKNKLAELKSYESILIEEVFSLVQEVLEFALLSRNRCYDHHAITKKVEPLLEIAELVSISKARKEGDQ